MGMGGVLGPRVVIVFCVEFVETRGEDLMIVEICLSVLCLISV